MKNSSLPSSQESLKEKFGWLEKKINIRFKNKNLLIQAFVHRSFLNEVPEEGMKHNERLEFLGDAVLEHIVTVFLFKKYPEESEGTLTAWRAALVNSKTLAECAEELGFEEFLLLSRGENNDNRKSKQFILANTLEAFIGALYLDRGLKVCDSFINENLIKKLDNIIANKLFLDSKSHFQEMAQEKKGVTPTYRVVREWGPDHAKHFVVGVCLGRELVAKGEGLSKQEAEEEAAEKALKIKNW